MSNKIEDATNIIINHLLDEFLSVVYEGNEKSANEKIEKCMMAYRQLRHKSNAYKNFLEELKKINELEEELHI